MSLSTILGPRGLTGGGLLQPAVNAGAVRVSPMQLQQTLITMLGSDLGRDIDASFVGDEGPRSYLTTNDFASKYNNRSLHKMSRHLTQSAINMLSGFDMLTQACTLAITHEQHWSSYKAEIINYQWIRAAIGTQPNTTSMVRYTEKGSLARRRHFQEINTVLLADPNFGADNLATALAMAIHTFVYTLLIEVCRGLADRAWQIDRKQMQMVDPTYRDEFRDTFERVTRFMFLFNKSPSEAVIAISQALAKLEGDYDRVLYAQDTQHFLANLLKSDIRSFPNKMLDVTEDAYMTGTDFDALSVAEKPYGVVRMGQRDVVAIMCPTLKELRVVPKEQGLQVLLRDIAFASLFLFRPVNYASLNGRTPTTEDLSVEIPSMDRIDGRWERITMHDALLRTRCGYWFAGPDSHEPDGPVATRIGGTGPDAAKGMYDRLADVRDADTVSKKAAAKTSRDLKVFDTTNTQFRELPTFAGFTTDGGAGDTRSLIEGLRPARQVGEITEQYLPSDTLVTMARHWIAQHPERAARHQFLTRVLPGTSLPNLNAERVALANATVTGDTAIDRLNELTTLYVAMVGKRPGQNSAGANAAQVNLPVAGAPGPNAKGLKSSVFGAFLGKLPDTATEHLAPFDGAFAHLEANGTAKDKELLDRLVGSMWAQRFDSVLQDHDVGKAGYMAKLLAAELRKAGFDDKAPTAAPSLAANNEAIFRALKSTIAPAAEMQSNSRIVADRLAAPEWSFSRSFARSAPASTLGSAASLGAQFEVADGGLGLGGPLQSFGGLDDVLPMDVTRIEYVATNLAQTLTTDELFIFFQLCRVELTPRNLAHLARMGVALVNVGLLRIGEVLSVYNMIACKREAHTIYMAPMQTSISFDASLENARLFYDYQAGLAVNDSFGIREIPSIMNNAVEFGCNHYIQETIDEFKQQIEWHPGAKTPDELDSVTVLIMPLTETKHAFPLLSPLGKWSMDYKTRNNLHSLSVGFSQLDYVIPQTENFFARAAGLMDELINSDNGGAGYYWCPLVHRGTVRYYNHVTNAFDQYRFGTGPLHNELTAIPSNMADVCNGKYTFFRATPNELVLASS